MSGMPSEREIQLCGHYLLTSGELPHMHGHFTTHNLLPFMSQFFLRRQKKNAKTEASTSLPRAHSADNSSSKVAFLAAALPASSQGKPTCPGTQQKTTTSLPYQEELMQNLT
jgi:hypothetical protein